MTGVSNTEKMNLNIEAVRNSFSVLNDKRWGIMCIVGASTIIKFFANIVSNAFQMKVKMLNNIDEAREYVTKNDLTLPHSTD